MRGGSHYPVGGSSEIAYNILPVIEAAGGRVLVRANVTEILERAGKVCGVRVTKGTETHEILAPLVISSAGQSTYIHQKFCNVLDYFRLVQHVPKTPSSEAGCQVLLYSDLQRAQAR